MAQEEGGGRKKNRASEMKEALKSRMSVVNRVFQRPGSDGEPITKEMVPIKTSNKSASPKKPASRGTTSKNQRSKSVKEEKIEKPNTECSDSVTMPVDLEKKVAPPNNQHKDSLNKIEQKGEKLNAKEAKENRMQKRKKAYMRYTRKLSKLHSSDDGCETLEWKYRTVLEETNNLEAVFKDNYKAIDALTRKVMTEVSEQEKSKIKALSNLRKTVSQQLAEEVKNEAELAVILKEMKASTSQRRSVKIFRWSSPSEWF